MEFIYGVDKLTLEKALEIAQGQLSASLSSQSLKQIRQSRDRVGFILDANQAVYGINTGFGPLCDTAINKSQTSTLQRNLLISHAVGVGEPIKPILSRLMLVLKIHALCLGYSGVRLCIIERLLLFLEKDLIPVVPEQGSVGASGDLAPLAHLFLPLIGEGECWYKGERVPTQRLYTELGIDSLSLEAKEGLALINGTQFILAHAIWGVSRMHYLLELADVVGALSLEGLQGSPAPFRKELHLLRPFKGTQEVAQRMRILLEGSENVASHQSCPRVQDPYSLRCIPQVHGASRNAWHHLKELVEIEMNSVTDNPVILENGQAISGGNFHGQPLAMALDYATVAAAELGNISDRRCYLLLEGRYGLPRLLVENGGLNSGYMIVQYSTAALVSENKSLCFPASADSIPTSLGQEDHVSMGSISGRKFLTVLANLEKILAIELLLGTQAATFRRPLKYAVFLEELIHFIQEHVPPLEQDRLIKKDIDALVELVHKQKISVLLEALPLKAELSK